MYFLLFAIACIGLTHIIVDSRLFEPIRKRILAWEIEWLTDLVTCYQCSSVHVGFYLALIFDPLGTYPWWATLNINGWAGTILFILGYVGQAVLWGFASSYLAMLGAALLNFLDRPWPYVEK